MPGVDRFYNVHSISNRVNEEKVSKKKVINKYKFLDNPPHNLGYAKVCYSWSGLTPKN